MAFRGTWFPDAQDGVLDGSPLLARPADAVVRLSHGIGLPARYPDILGLAIRVLNVYGPGRHQDLLLASAGSGRWTRHLLRPARDYTRIALSTLLPYDVDGRRAPIVAHVGPTANTATYAEIVHMGANAVPLFNLFVGSPTGPRIARVVTADRLARWDDALRFDPWNTGPELRPVGRLNRLRRPTYRASQQGRGAVGREVRARRRDTEVQNARSKGERHAG